MTARTPIADDVDDLEGFTIQEVAKRLRVHANTVRNWIDDGSLKVVVLGERGTRIRPSQLRTFLDEHTTK